MHRAKRKLLEDYRIVVWRDHDHLHGPGGPGCTVHTEIDYIARWLPEVIGTEFPVHFVPSGDSFGYLLR